MAWLIMASTGTTLSVFFRYCSAWWIQPVRAIRQIVRFLPFIEPDFMQVQARATIFRSSSGMRWCARSRC